VLLLEHRAPHGLQRLRGGVEGGRCGVGLDGWARERPGSQTCRKPRACPAAVVAGPGSHLRAWPTSLGEWPPPKRQGPPSPRRRPARGTPRPWPQAASPPQQQGPECAPAAPAASKIAACKAWPCKRPAARAPASASAQAAPRKAQPRTHRPPGAAPTPPRPPSPLPPRGTRPARQRRTASDAGAWTLRLARQQPRHAPPARLQAPHLQHHPSGGHARP